MRCEAEVIHYGWLEGPPYMSKEEWQKSHICGVSWTGRVTDNRDEVRQIAEGRMTTGSIICTGGWPLCYRPGCEHEATLQCDYRVDHWGNTCDAWMCREHATAVSFGRDHCTGHEPPKNQGRMAL